MELLRFTVRNQRLSGGRIRLVSDSIDYVEAFFDFRTEDWEGLSKWAHFSKGEVTYDINLAEDRITKEMHLNLEEGTWEVKLHGTDSAGTMRITTDTAFVIVEAFGEGFNPLPEIPLSAAEQIDAKAQLAVEIARSAEGSAGNAVEVALEIKRMADNGEFDGKDGETGKTPEIQIGNIETLPPEAEATVSIGGTAEKPILNFGIPKGNTGEDGIGIEDVETQMSAEDGGFNVLTIRLTDGRSFGWAIMNGHKGETGKPGPGLVWAGEWTPEGDYRAIRDGQVSRDVVMYNGSAYVVAVNNPAPVMGIVPEGDTTGRWALFVSKGEKGEKGEDGSTENIDERLSEIEEELEKINPFKVESFSVNPSVAELGSKVSSVVLSWGLNKEPAKVSIDGTAVSAAKNGSHTVSEEISGTRKFVISAETENGKTATDDVYINFYNGIYYGAAPETIQGTEGLTKVLSNSRKRTFTVTANEGEHIFYILPARLGEPVFKVGGFEGGFNLYKTIDFTNNYGYSESYRVYVSTEDGLGNTTVEVS